MFYGPLCSIYQSVYSMVVKHGVKKTESEIQRSMNRDELGICSLIIHILNLHDSKINHKLKSRLCVLRP